MRESVCAGQVDHEPRRRLSSLPPVLRAGRAAPGHRAGRLEQDEAGRVHGRLLRR